MPGARNFFVGEVVTSTSPITAVISSIETAPYLKITGFSPSNATIVDSIPTAHGPPSNTSGIRPLSERTTC